jgi:oligosaccharide repeat unit polymerase
VIDLLANPLFLFLTVWGSATLLYLGGVSANLFPRDVPDVTWIAFLNVLTFSLGYLTWSMLACPRPLGHEMDSTPGVPLTARRLRTALNTTLVFGLIAVALCAARLVILSRMYQIDLTRLLWNPRLWRRVVTAVITSSMYEIRLCTIAITLTSSIFSVGFVLLGILLYVGRGRRRYGTVLLFLSISVSIALLSLGRQEVTINVLFLVLSYLSMHRLYHLRRTWEAVRPLAVPLAALVLLFVAIDLLLRKSRTYEREDRLMGFLFSVYWYMASPLAAFAQYLKDAGHTWTGGQSLFFPVYKWLARLHLVPEPTKTVLTEWFYIPYPANVFSYLRDIHEDFGFVGLAVVPYILGSLAAVLRRRAEVFFPYLNLYLALLVLLVFSFYNYLLVSNQFYTQVLFALLFFRFQLLGLDKLSL